MEIVGSLILAILQSILFYGKTIGISILILVGKCKELQLQEHWLIIQI